MIETLPGNIGVDLLGQPVWQFTVRPEPGSQNYEITGNSIIVNPENINYLQHTIKVVGNAMIGRNLT